MTFPHQSIRAGCSSLRSSSIMYAHTVPKIPTGTDARKTRRQSSGPRTPPRISPMNDPEVAATMLMPRAKPRWLMGKASVRMALELAINNAEPTAWQTRPPIK